MSNNSLLSGLGSSPYGGGSASPVPPVGGKTGGRRSRRSRGSRRRGSRRR